MREGERGEGERARWGVDYFCGMEGVFLRIHLGDVRNLIETPKRQHRFSVGSHSNWLSSKKEYTSLLHVYVERHWVSSHAQASSSVARSQACNKFRHKI